MSHIHLPDGVLPAWLWLSVYALISLVIGVLWRWGKANVEPRKFALLGIFSAMIILVAMIEIPPFAYHFNLSVVSGIVLGPRLSVVAAVMVNLILSLIGHGGITVLGLNSFVLSTEMIAGYYIFKALSRFRVSLPTAGFLSTVVSLAIGTLVSYSIIVIGSPWIDRILQAAGPADIELAPGAVGTHLNLIRLAVVMFGIGSIGWVLEGILSSAALRYLVKVYPELIGGRYSKLNQPAVEDNIGDK